jgi:hypothetical protein
MSDKFEYKEHDRELQELEVLLQHFRSLIKATPYQNIYGSDDREIRPEDQDEGFDSNLLQNFNELAKRFGEIVVYVPGGGQFYPDKIVALKNGTVIWEKKVSAGDYEPDVLTYTILSREEGKKKLQKIVVQLKEQILEAQNSLRPIERYLEIK